MRTFIITLTVLAGLCLLFGSCTKEHHTQPNNTAIVVMGDYTDSLAMHPEPKQIKETYNLRHNIWHGGSFRYVTLSDVDYSPVYETQIEPKTIIAQLTGNEIKRMGEVKAYLNDIDAIVKQVQAQAIGKSHSALYKTIARELNRLQKQKAGNKLALIYSDLFENSDWYSVYNPDHLQVLRSNPDSVLTLFQKEEALHDLTGITVHIIYIPKTREDNRRFRLMSTLYKTMLEKAGAQVEISANLQL